MKHYFLTKIHHVAMMLLLLLIGVQTAQANDEFEKQENFMIVKSGQSSLHFRVLTWSYGYIRNHWAGMDGGKMSEILVKRCRIADDGKIINDPNVKPQVVANFRGYNSSSENSQRKARLKIYKGTATITNSKEMPHGVDVEAGGDVTTEVNGLEDYTFLEFDWFVPNEMIVEHDGDKEIKYAIIVTMNVVDDHPGILDNRSYPKDGEADWTFNFSDTYSPASLEEPVFYPLSGSGNVGKLAVPYSIQYRPLTYTTNLDKSGETHPISAQGGLIFVDAADTCRASFTVTFNALRDSQSGLTWKVPANSVPLLAYHRIYDFKVSKYVPTDGVYKDFYTGSKKLEWDVHYANQDDILEDDYFVIERAYSSDFSDAEQITSIPYMPRLASADEHDENARINYKRHYEYVDDSQGAWFNSEDPERPIFYRVRRASSEPWGWNHNWAAKDSIAEPVYLASPSCNIPVQVVKDKDFENNRKIEVIISMESSCVPAVVQHDMGNKDEYDNVVRNLIWDKSATLNLVRHMTHTEGVEDAEIVKIPVPASSITYDLVGKCWKARVYDTPKFPCTYYSYSVEVVTDFNTIIPTMTEKNISHIIPPVKEGSVGDYIVAVTGVTSVPDYAESFIKTENFYFSKAATPTNLRVSQDEYNDHVALIWDNTAGECDYYIITRSDGNSSVQLSPTSTTDMLSECFFNDSTAISGVTYTYSVQAVLQCENGTIEKSEIVSAQGSANCKGHIFGKLYYTNGMAVANQKVVTTYDNKEYFAITNEDGSYDIEIPQRPTAKDGEITITVTVADSTGTLGFTLPGQTGKNRNVVLSETQGNVYGCDFASDQYIKFTGRVLYEGTSVPVAGASFLLSGKVAKNIEGNAVITDSQGNFEMAVPKARTFTLQAVKEKHKFKHDGYFTVTDRRTNEPTNKLSFSEHQYDKYMWDQTKVKLIGRVVGGDDQGSKVLGLDRSKNNLGDDLQMVFALEGNDVAHLVYNPEDRTEKERELTFTHADSIHKTKAKFETRRIVVNPDPESGEYVIELLPEKYKVIQATAKGYSTLFAQNVGASVVDLGNKLDTLYIETGEDDLFIPYNEHFNIIYHSPVQLTYQQTNYGHAVDYYGDEELEMSDFAAKTTHVKAVNVKHDGSISYLFGYPVFNGITFNNAYKNKYTFNLSAHEDYYYNNDMQSHAPDVVYLKGGMVKISNGFDAKPDSKAEYVKLNKNGKATVSIPVYNPTFSLTGEDALRYLQFSMDYNGQTVFSEALKAYITGAKEMGSDVIGKDIQVFDVLRDPPGSASNAWLEQGTTYGGTFVFDVSYNAGINMKMTFGSEINTVSGVIANMTAFNGNIGTSGKENTVVLPITGGDKFKTTYSYSYTTTERIQTSSSDSYVGNMANVYIGTEIAAVLNRYETISTINDSTYQRLAPAIKSGEVKVIAKGTVKDENGEDQPVYLVISKQISFSAESGSTFAHTQKHIIKNLIPELTATRNALIQIGDENTLRKLAQTSGKIIYRSKVDDINSENFGAEDFYDVLYPNEAVELTKENKVRDLNNSINSWVSAIASNERIMLETFYSPSKYAGVSVSAGTSKQYTESTSVSYNYNTPTNWSNVRTSMLKFPLKVGGQLANLLIKFAKSQKGAFWGKDGSNPLMDEGLKLPDLGYQSKADEVIKDALAKQQAEKQKENKEGKTSLFGVSFKWNLEPVLDINLNSTMDESKKGTRTVGFKIEEGSHGHVNVGVYRTTKSLSSQNAWDFVMNPEDKEYVGDVQEIMGEHTRKSIPDENGNVVALDDEKYTASDFVFIRYGGATRCPYEDADYTLFYQPGTKLNNATLKIDDPHIQVTNPVVSDIPEDQPAVFDIVLSNESEAPEADGYIIDKTFNFSIDAASNPNGAKFYLDGYPLANGMSLVIPRGQAVHKKLEMYRGTADDYENIKILFYTSCEFGNGVSTKVSAHFQPTSTPLNLSSPTEQWVMNTLSPQNDGKFYIPVKIDGFNTEYRNFDHIELQYKRSTQPDADYVNLCSFYADSALYAKASGEKRLIKGGVIDDLYFYGENDPVEQNYDLRAVSFCRLGNSFVTRTSKVLSGVKDTRRPEVFGAVSPKTGVLGIGDYIGIPFSENIAGNHLDQTTSFEVVGYTNKTGIVNSTALLFDGTEGSCAKTELSRNLAHKNFTIDMMVKPDELFQGKQMTFFTQGNDNSNIVFGSKAGYKLFMNMTVNGMKKEVVAEKAYCGENPDWTRVSAVYEADSGKVTFYAGNTVLGSDTLFIGYDGVGPIAYGCGRDGKDPYAGKMLEARLWTKALTPTDLSSTNLVTLTGYERKLLAYYPMNNGKGTLLEDKANGASLSLNGQSWSLPSGRSLQFKGDRGVELDKSLFSRSSESSYMLGLWFKAEENKNDSLTALYAEGDGTENTNGLFIGLENKQLKVAQHGFSAKAVGNYADGNWHHVVLGVDRIANKAHVNVDGNKVMQFAADSLGALGINTLMLGAYRKKVSGEVAEDIYCLTGNIDDVMLWETVMSNDYMKHFDNSAPNGGELGLIVNLPFSKGKANDGNFIESKYDGCNHLTKKERNSQIYNKQIVLSPYAEKMSDDISIAPIRDKDLISTLKFSYASKDNELIMNLKVDDAEINKQNVFITVYDVEDMAGNTIASPVNMTLFIDRNQLKWEQKYVTREIWTGDDDEFTVDIHNHGGTELNYSIDDLPDWLIVDNKYGSLSPTDVRPVKFKVKNNLNAGEHSSLIYLTDQNGLYEPLLVTVNVKAEAPDWYVDRKLFSETMNLVGTVIVKDNGREVFDTDNDDIVGAFIDNVCVGVQNINSDADSQGSIYMTIYGNDRVSDKKYMDMLANNDTIMDVYGKNIVFRLWRSKTGQISELALNDGEEDIEIVFTPDLLCGSPDEPIRMTTMQRSSQILALNSGWNWVSFNIATDTSKGNFTEAISNRYQFSDGDIVKGRGSFSQYLVETGWQGNLNQFDHHYCYMFRLEDAGNIEFFGNELDKDEMRVLKLRKGWNNLPYFGKHVVSLKNAMADYVGSEGDIIKSYTEFAICDKDGNWKGSLSDMRPGEGYMLFSKGIKEGEIRDFRYQVNEYFDGANSSVVAAPRRTFVGEHSGNMTVVAEALMSDGTKAVQGDLLQAYCGDELVGEAVADNEGKFFLMTSAENGDEISFRITRSSDNSEALASTTPILGFDEATGIGTLTDPFVVDFRGSKVGAYPNPFRDVITFSAEATPGDAVSIRVFNTAGGLVFSHDDKAESNRFEYTTHKLASIPQGVYVARITVGDVEKAVKIVKK